MTIKSIKIATNYNRSIINCHEKLLFFNKKTIVSSSNKMKLVLHRNYSIKLYNRDDKSMILFSNNSCSTKKKKIYLR